MSGVVCYAVMDNSNTLLVLYNESLQNQWVTTIVTILLSLILEGEWAKLGGHHLSLTQL